MKPKILDVDDSKIDACISRLMDGTAVRTDFRDFVDALKAWSARADEDGLGGMGEAGTKARGVALAYRAILRRIEEAVSPKEDFEQVEKEIL